MRKTPHIYGLLAEFDGPDQLLVATRAAHRAGYRRMDAYTPFPVHGLASALGLRTTRLPWIVFIGGLIGAIGGFGMQYFAFVIDYPYNIGGRPLNSWPSWIIITFECTILAAAFSAVFGMLALNGLPRPYHPLFYVPNFELASRTHFFLCIEANDPKFDLHDTQAFLRSLAPNSLAVVPASKLKEERSPVDAAPFIPETMPGRVTSPAIGGHGEGQAESGEEAARPVDPSDRGHGGGGGGSSTLASLLIGTLTLLPLLGFAGGCDMNDLNVDLQGNMEDHSRMTPMEPSPFFENGTSARPLVDGTVPRGDARLDEHLYTGFVGGKEAETFPFPVTRQVLARGRTEFEAKCAHCHNSTGDGLGMIVQRGFVRPPSLHLDRLKDAPPGHFFNVITNGWGAMYSHNDRVKVEDRWAIAAHIKVLQLSRAADPGQLPPDERARLEAALASAATRPAAAAAGDGHGQQVPRSQYPSHGPATTVPAATPTTQPTQEVTR